MRFSICRVRSFICSAFLSSSNSSGSAGCGGEGGGEESGREGMRTGCIGALVGACAWLKNTVETPESAAGRFAHSRASFSARTVWMTRSTASRLIRWLMIVFTSFNS